MIPAGLNFSRGEELELLRLSMVRLAQTEIAPLAHSIDANNEFPKTL